MPELETGYTLTLHKCHCFPELSLLGRQGAAVWGGRGTCLGGCSKYGIASASSLPWHVGLFPGYITYNCGRGLWRESRISPTSQSFCYIPSPSNYSKNEMIQCVGFASNSYQREEKGGGIDWPWVANCWSWFTGTWSLWLLYMVYKVCLKFSVIKMKL